MATLAPALAAPPRLRLPRLGAEATTALVLLVAALVLRWPQLGDPAYDIDEQWYLVVGDRLLHGQLPYVDWWDRKPLGLFLLYAAIRTLGGGVVPYQLAASLAAGATAWTIARLSRPAAGPTGGALAGLAYLAWIETVGGGGGQAPVFYNLPVALAAEQVLRAAAARDGAEARAAGRWAMLLTGVAIQLKYTVLVEGLWFGAVLAWTVMRTMAPPRWLRHVATLVALALAPTALAFVAYALLGHGREFWFANFVSIFGRAPEDTAGVHHRLWMIGAQFLPFACCLLPALLTLRTAAPKVRRRQLFVLGWGVAALGGFASVGAFYYHYALPLFVPACVAIAPALAPRVGRLVGLVLALLPVWHLGWPDWRTTAEDRAAVTRLAHLLPRAVTTRCLQLFDGPPVLFLASGACPASRYAFPDHLIAAKESRGLGIDRAVEIDRLFARGPAAVVVAARTYRPEPRMERLMRARLAAAYQRAGSAILDERRLDVYIRR